MLTAPLDGMHATPHATWKTLQDQSSSFSAKRGQGKNLKDVGGAYRYIN